MQFKETLLNNNPCLFLDTKKTFLKKLPSYYDKVSGQGWSTHFPGMGKSHYETPCM